MNDLISRQAAIVAIRAGPEGNWSREKYAQEIMKVPPAQQWIPVSERLPEDGRYLCDYGDCIDFGCVTNGEWFVGGVIAWMPLPEPYKRRSEMDERKMIYLEDAIKAVCDEFTTVYCYNCANQESEDQCEWCHRKSMNWSVSRNTVKRILNNLPSAQPERKTGKWILGEIETGAVNVQYQWERCSECGWESSLVIPRNFCPNCGAEMERSEECQS